MTLHQFSQENPNSNVLLASLEEEVKNSKWNIIQKQTGLILQKVFAENYDRTKLIGEIEEHLTRVRDPVSRLLPVNNCSIFMNYFLSSLKMQMGDVDSATNYAVDTLKEVKEYYGHQESDYCVDPMLILLHGGFEKLTRVELPQDEYAKQLAALNSQAKECEKLILLIMGEKSEKLAEIYCLYSFFDL